MRITVLLTARHDGMKLHPFVLLPRKRQIPEIVKRYKNKLILSWCGRNWMDNALTTSYLTEVYFLKYRILKLPEFKFLHIGIWKFLFRVPIVDL